MSGQPETAAERNRHVTQSSSGADDVDLLFTNDESITKLLNGINPDNTVAPPHKKLSEKKSPPKKKSAATKAKKPNQKREGAKNVLWNTNYEIVEKACIVLNTMATMTTKQFSEDSWKSIKENGNKERLAWSQLVGNDTHKCPYLPRGTKVSLCEIVTLVAKDTDKNEANKTVKRVSQFLRNSKYDHSHRQTLPDWKKDLVNQLKVDILK